MENISNNEKVSDLDSLYLFYGPEKYLIEEAVKK